MNGETTDKTNSVNSAENTDFTPVMHPVWSNGAFTHQRKYYEIKRKDIIFAIVCFFIAVIGVPLSLWGGFRGGFTLFYILSFACLTVYLNNKKADFFGTVCGVLSFIGSGVFIYSANVTVKFFLLIFMAVTSAVYVISLTGNPLKRADSDLIFGTAKFYCSAFQELPTALRSFFTGKNATVLRKILIGFLCAIPLLLIVVPLLQSADMAFENLTSTLAKSFGTYIFKFICGTFFALAIISLALSLKNNGFKYYQFKGAKINENIYLISFLGITSAVYLLYMFSQFAYITDVFRSVLPSGITVSQYARRGFLQMCIVAGINLVLIYASTRLINVERKSSYVIKGECLFIGIFTLFIISSSIAKTVMYINRFSLTQLRLFSAVFAVFIAITVLAVLFKMFFKKIAVFRISLVAGILLVSLLGFTDVNAFIANCNVNGYLSGRYSSPDVEYIESLGLSAVPALVRLESGCREQKEYAYAIEIRQSLKNMEDKYGNPKQNGIGSYNYSEYKGLKILEEYFSQNNNG